MSRLNSLWFNIFVFFLHSHRKCHFSHSSSQSSHTHVDAELWKLFDFRWNLGCKCAMLHHAIRPLWYGRRMCRKRGSNDRLRARRLYMCVRDLQVLFSWLQILITSLLDKYCVAHCINSHVKVKWAGNIEKNVDTD